jgi:hypothetical protein
VRGVTDHVPRRPGYEVYCDYEKWLDKCFDDSTYVQALLFCCIVYFPVIFIFQVWSPVGEADSEDLRIVYWVKRVFRRVFIQRFL